MTTTISKSDLKVRANERWNDLRAHHQGSPLPASLAHSPTHPLTHSPSPSSPVAPSGTDLQAPGSTLQAAISSAYHAAQSAAQHAVLKALYCGALLLKAKHLAGHGQFLPWLKTNCPDVPERTARHWMALAEKTAHHALAGHDAIRCLDDGLLEVAGQQVHLADLLAQFPITVEDDQRGGASPLPHGQAELRREGQGEGLHSVLHAVCSMLLAFITGRTIKECLSGCVLDGDDPSRLTRAHNGLTFGGHNGEDRRDYPEYLKRNLAKFTTHLGHWDAYSPDQKETAKFVVHQAIKTWPTPFLQTLANFAREELKNR